MLTNNFLALSQTSELSAHEPLPPAPRWPAAEAGAAWRRPRGLRAARCGHATARLAARAYPAGPYGYEPAPTCERVPGRWGDEDGWPAAR